MAPGDGSGLSGSTENVEEAFFFGFPADIFSYVGPGATGYYGAPWGCALERYPDYASTNITLPFISVTNFASGVFQVPDSWIPPYAYGFDLHAQAIRADGRAGSPASIQFYTQPFVDQSALLRQNAAFLLRIADYSPFSSICTQTVDGYEVNYTVSYPDPYYGRYYVWASWYLYDPPDNLFSYAPLLPAEDNYAYANLVFNPLATDSKGRLTTGFETKSQNVGQLSLEFGTYRYTNLAITFPYSSYIRYSNAAAIAPAPVSSAFIGCYQPLTNLASLLDPPSRYGINVSQGVATLGSAANIYGLRYDSAQLALSNGGFALLTPSNAVGPYNGASGGGPFYVNTRQPVLATVGYYFSNPFRYPPDSMPENGSFRTNATTPAIFGSVGESMTVAGHAKQLLQNGRANVFAYIGQYFTNSFLLNGTAETTNSAGIVSPDGGFFPTSPGSAHLYTFLDASQTNAQGHCTIDLIRLSLDVNHDGIMDETPTGPDNTTEDVPYVFWSNNNYDRWHTTTLDGRVEDDLQSAAQPDSDYTDTNGNRVIPSPRDLEDFARLWVSGASNALSHLPTGSAATLAWSPVDNPPTIDIFQAADTDGGLGYLTNGAIASNQVNSALCKYVGRLGPNDTITLNDPSFPGGWAGDHLIFCGVSGGSGVLYLTLYDNSGYEVVQSLQWVQIEDVKQLYERWTVGDAATNGPAGHITPSTVAALVHDTQPQFAYPVDPVFDTNTDYILFVHGWNLPTWEKDAFAESAFKRLYWQGYQGRFGSFRWPTTTLGAGNLLTSYDNGEWAAWLSGTGLYNKLTELNRQYAGRVYVLAHSMGNVVASEALRLAGTNVIVNTYVASQAAISARAFDNAIPADATNSYAHVFTPDTEGHYYTNGASAYFNGLLGALNFVDYYNTLDWALNLWRSNQGSKPDNSYYYSTSFTQHPSGYYQQFGIRPYRNLTFPADTYETFAKAVQSYSFSLGAEAVIPRVFSNAPTINLNSTAFAYGGAHLGHSLQFRSDTAAAAAYWRQFLVSCAINH